MTSIPILDAYLSLDRADLHVACNYCWAWHDHGTGGAVAEVEHRAAHCWVTTSPYIGKGYLLRMVGEWDAAREKTRPWVTAPRPLTPKSKRRKWVRVTRPA